MQLASETNTPRLKKYSSQCSMYTKTKPKLLLQGT